MADLPHHLSHLMVTGRTGDRAFSRKGGGGKVRPIADRAAHGRRCLGELQGAFELAEEQRATLGLEELRAWGSVVTIEGCGDEYQLKLESLERHVPRRSEHKWALLSVTPGRNGEPERATVWVSDAHRGEFLKLFEDYLHKDTESGRPKNNDLVANIARIRETVLRDLWQSDGEPPLSSKVWWELWLRLDENGAVLLSRYAEQRGLRLLKRELRISSRLVLWLEGTWRQLEDLPFTAVPIAEIRRPEFIDTIEDLSSQRQAEYVDDLRLRLRPADSSAPAVCHLDTGVARTHVLLRDSLDEEDLHTVVGVAGFDREGHGTKMAGLALFGGSLDQLLIGNGTVALSHRLESVRILPSQGEPQHNPTTYCEVTAQAVSHPEITAGRRRVFCMPVSSKGDSPSDPGQPTLWSAAVDALCCGTDVVSSSRGLELLSKPRGDAARLFVISAGNVRSFEQNHLDLSDLSAIENPGQAWNALTVGACTSLHQTPTDPAYAGWNAVAEAGDLSPHSRTSLLYSGNMWPLKPDIVMEGGNLLHDGASLFETAHPLLSLRTTDKVNDQSLTSANATSAATAQAARLAALVMSAYPEYWPETVRAMLVHSAEWTPRMRQQIDAAGRTGLKKRQAMLRRYGWGVPNEERVLHSSEQAVTLVVQDQFTPFVGSDFKLPNLRLHTLPWPREVLEMLGESRVDLRVTLSYFIEPTASRRGWRRKYSYASHGLRFQVQDPLEDEEQFIRRVNREARAAEEGDERPSGSRVKWLVGENQRNLGSLHQDIWETTGAMLASSGRIAVYPIGGWWKHNRNSERMDQLVRYALVISLRAPDSQTDLYTPIQTLLATPVAVSVQ